MHMKVRLNKICTVIDLVALLTMNIYSQWNITVASYKYVKLCNENIN